MTIILMNYYVLFIAEKFLEKYVHRFDISKASAFSASLLWASTISLQNVYEYIEGKIHQLAEQDQMHVPQH